MKLKENKETKNENTWDKVLKDIIEKGYIPIEGNLDTSNPPKGGSGVPSQSPVGKEKVDS